MKKTKIYLLLHGLMLLISISPVFSKLAGRQPMFSFKFFLFYGCSLFLLAIYALFWQQVIKRMPLSTAYANKAITVVWGMIWGFLVFGEGITVQKVIGVIIIIAGVVLFASSQESTGEDNA